METQGHHRCGSLNLNVRGLGQSATLAINERSNVLRREGHRVYKLGLGQSPFPIPSEVVNALRLHAHEDDYLPVAGLPALREAVAEFHRQKDRVQARPEGVLVRARLKGTPVPLAADLLRRIARAVSSLGVLYPAGPHHWSYRQSDPDDIRRELARLPPAPGSHLQSRSRTGRVFWC